MFDDDDGVALVAQPVEHSQQLRDVGEVQSGGGFVENVQGATGGALRELFRKLDALRLAARQRRRALSQSNIGQADVEQRLQLGLHGRHRGEERQRILDRHVQDLLDVLALEADFQGFPVVALALADVAGNIYVGEEVHFHFDDAVTLARFAAPALDVEAEPAGFVAARACLRHCGIDLSYRREQPGIRRRIGARCAADRTLIDLDHPIDVIQPLDAVEMRGSRRRVVQLRGHRSKQSVVDQCRFARSRHAGNAGHQAQRELRRDIFEIVGRRARHSQQTLRIRSAPGARYLDSHAAAQVLAGDGIRMSDDFRGRALRHHLAAMHAGSRPEIDDIIGLPDRILVVLDHDDRIAEIAQIRQRVEQPLIVALVQADRGFIEDVHDADQARTDLACQPDALRFAAGQRIGAAIQGQIAQAHVSQEAEPIADLLDDLDRNFTAPAG